jgi:predicted phosphate transport protein (TIGR00153 family)
MQISPADVGRGGLWEGHQETIMFANKWNATYYDLLDAQAAAAHRAAKVFHALVGDFGNIVDYLKQIETIEHEADELTRSFVNKVNTQFITPLDKEDMHMLTARLDDVTDTIENAASHIQVFGLRAPRPELKSMVEMLVAITGETQKIVGQLRQGLNQPSLTPMLAGIHAMETRVDRLFRQALTTLFDDQTIDTRLVIKWKEVYELIEEAINQTEKLTGTIETLIIKYA